MKISTNAEKEFNEIQHSFQRRKTKHGENKAQQNKKSWALPSYTKIHYIAYNICVYLKI